MSDQNQDPADEAVEQHRGHDTGKAQPQIRPDKPGDRPGDQANGTGPAGSGPQRPNENAAEPGTGS